MRYSSLRTRTVPYNTMSFTDFPLVCVDLRKVGYVRSSVRGSLRRLLSIPGLSYHCPNTCIQSLLLFIPDPDNSHSYCLPNIQASNKRLFYFNTVPVVSIYYL